MTAVQPPPPAEDGSTQPLETQVYRDYYLNVERTSKHEHGHTASLDPMRSSATEHQANMSRHLLLSDPHDIGAPDLSDDDPARPPNRPTSPTFYDPKTPLSTGKKRDRRGNVLQSPEGLASSSHHKRFPTTFGPRAAPPLTQLFEATQADASSPLHLYEALQDPAFERPSPDGAFALPETPSSPRSPTHGTLSKVALEPETHYEPINPHSGRGFDSSAPPSTPASMDEEHVEVNGVFSAPTCPGTKRIRKTSAGQSDSNEWKKTGKHRDRLSMTPGFVENAAQPYTPGRTAQRPILLSSNIRRPTIDPGLDQVSLMQLSSPDQDAPSDSRNRAVTLLKGPTASAQPVISHKSPYAMSPNTGTAKNEFDGTQRLVGSTQAPLSPNPNVQNMINGLQREQLDTQRVCTRSSSTHRGNNPGQTIPETSPAEARSTGRSALQFHDDDRSITSFRATLPGSASTRLRARSLGRGSEHGRSPTLPNNTVASTTCVPFPTHDTASAASSEPVADPRNRELQLNGQDVVPSTQSLSTPAIDLDIVPSRSSFGARKEISQGQAAECGNSIKNTEDKEPLAGPDVPSCELGQNRTKLRVGSNHGLPDSLQHGDRPRSRPVSKGQPVSLRPCSLEPSSPHRPDDNQLVLEHPKDLRPNASINSSNPTSADVKSCRGAPFRVWACFKGFTRAPTFYPASCISEEPHAKRTFRVRFDDGANASVEEHLLIALDLQEGDHVKVDKSGLRNHVYVVKGLKDRIASPVKVQDPACDIHGHQLVSLRMKGAHDDSELLEVSVGDIYVTSTMWRPFEKRANACGQRSFRTQQPLQSNETLQQAVEVADVHAPRQASTALLNTKIFSNMAFALSFSASGDSMRQSVTSIAKANGARLLDRGFEELFVVRSEQNEEDQARWLPRIARTQTLQLNERGARIGFVALISDTQLRTAKYLQALALNMPCLSGRWMIDSVEAGTPLPWRRYLLPAGESFVLDGAIRSRVLLGDLPQEPTSSAFKVFFENRPITLRGANVLLVAGRGKTAEEQATLLFLSHAMGAKSVKGAASVDEAEQILAASDPPELILCVDNAMIPEAKERLSTAKRQPAPKLSIDCDSLGQESRLFCKEALVQSLILGELYEM